MTVQSNQNDFAERLRRLEGRKTVPVNRGMVAEPVLAKDYGKKEKSNRSFFVVKSVLLLVCLIFGYRIATLTTGIDLDERRAELAKGTSGEKIASVIVSASMIADPILLPMFGYEKKEMAALDVQNVSASSALTPILPAKPSFVVNKPEQVAVNLPAGQKKSTES